MKACFVSPAAITAPLQDLTLLKQFASYKNVIPGISKVSVKKVRVFVVPQWKVSNAGLYVMKMYHLTQNASWCRQWVMVVMLKKALNVPQFPRLKSRIRNWRILLLLIVYNSSTFWNYRLSTEGHILQLQTDFLHKDPSEWECDITFSRAHGIATNLRVVNDNAERGAALITEYNRLITSVEEQKHYLLQVVSSITNSLTVGKKLWNTKSEHWSDFIAIALSSYVDEYFFWIVTSI